MIITRQLLREWDACYTDDKVAEVVLESGLTPLQILDLDIPADDRLWVVLREEVIPARELRLLACKWAREACAAANWTDSRSLNAIEVSERFARGEATEEEFAAAETAAEAAADAAAGAAREAQVQDCRRVLGG